MRIERITLKNFGSYRDETVDLTTIASAVVLGPNGAGKSTAFIDAVLWALYGQARSATDHMIRTGEQDMMVSLVFSLGSSRYRVIRKRSIQTKAGKSDLELQIQHADDWTPISGARLADTQENIIQLLNCDQDLLTATAFFLQGQADRFSKATPSERKTILASILRLDRYGLLKQEASRQATRQDERRAAKTEQLNDLDAAERDVVRLRQDLATTHEANEREHTHAAEAEQSRMVHVEAKASLQARIDAMVGLSLQLDQDRARLMTLKEREKALTAKHDRWDKILKNRETIEQKVQTHRDTTGAIAALEAGMAERQESIARCDGEIDTAQQNLTALQQLESWSARATIDVEQAVKDYRRQTQDLQAALDRDRTQVTLLDQVPCDSGLQKRCQFTLKAVEAQDRIPGQEAAIAARPSDQIEIVVLVAGQKAQELQELDAKVEILRGEHSAQVAETAREHKRTLQVQQHESRQTIERHRATLRDLERFTILVPELELADREIAGITTDLALAIQERSDLDQAIKTQEVVLFGLDSLEGEVADRTVQIQRLHETQQQSIREQRRLTELTGKLTGQIEQAEQTIESGKAVREELATIDRDLRHYRALTEAYGIIPTLVLENSIPILEQETNALLGRVSKTGMRIRVDTQKTLKSRDGLAETLDIAVRDQVGERLYEAFSGGERARIDLALRLGLSRLLANRAGARIETVVLDEAFAAVDQEGVASLVECLPMLSRDFPLILVMTHDESLKQSLVQQIIVHKDERGSTVEVVA